MSSNLWGRILQRPLSVRAKRLLIDNLNNACPIRGVFILFMVGFCFSAYTKSSHAGVVLIRDFENGDLSGWNPALCCDHSAEIVTSPVRFGQYAVKFKLDCDDPLVQNRHRAELSGYTAEMGLEYWYGFSIFVPNDWKEDDGWNIVAQWHGNPDEDLGETWRSPPLALQVVGGEWMVSNRSDSRPVTPPDYKDRDLWKVPLEKGRWTDWVFHVRWSYDDGGLLEVWKDDLKIVRKTGSVCYNDKRGPYFKIGIYRSDISYCPRIIYHDEVRIGDANTKYEEVAPQKSIPSKGFIIPQNLKLGLSS